MKKSDSRVKPEKVKKLKTIETASKAADLLAAPVKTPTMKKKLKVPSTSGSFVTQDKKKAVPPLKLSVLSGRGGESDSKPPTSSRLKKSVTKLSGSGLKKQTFSVSKIKKSASGSILERKTSASKLAVTPSAGEAAA